VTFTNILTVEPRENTAGLPFLLVAGRSDGVISRFIKMGGKEQNCSTRSPHLGEVQALAYSDNPELCLGIPGLLFSGSTDR